MAISNDVLEVLQAEPLGSVQPRVRDGDLLLCAGQDAFSRLIGWATESPWTHVALAFRWPGIHRVMVFESVQQFGVRAVTLQRFCQQSSSGRRPYPGRIILARHQDYASLGKPGGAAARHLADAGVDLFGDRFAPGEIPKIALRIAMDRTHRRTPTFLRPKGEYICSEYVAKCFSAVGIDVCWDGRGFIAPVDFAQDPKIKAIAQIKV